MNWSAKLLCVYLALSLVPPWHAVSRRALGAEPQGRPPDPAESRRQLSARLDRLFVTLADAARQLPRDSFDPQGVIARAGRDPSQLFAWVRDQTYWVPYRGALRGPRGVLMDRVGNSLDRSLCLAEILWSAGHRVRLARGELPVERARELRPAIRALPGDWLAAAAGDLSTSEPLNAMASALGLDAGHARAALDGATLRAARTAEDAARLVAEETPVLAAKLGRDPAPAAEEPADLAVLKDHWWVEMEERGSWKALDVLLPDAQPGAALVAAQATAPFPGKAGKLPLEPRDCHEVDIRVVIEGTGRGGSKESTALNHTLRPAEIVGEKIHLYHHPLKWPQRLTLSDADAQRYRAAVLAAREWLPILEVGRTQVSQSGFNTEGVLIPKPGKAAAEVARRVGGTVGGFADALGGGKDAKNEEAGRLTALWIEYEIRAPGQPPRILRRQLFDWIGPAARAARTPVPLDEDEARRLDRGLILLGDTEVLVLPCRLSPRFIEHLQVKRLLDNRRAILEACRDEKVRWPEEVYERITALTSPVDPLVDLAVARLDSSRSSGDLYFDRPNVLSLHGRLFMPPGRGPGFEEAFDIVANEVAVRAGSATDPFLVRLEQGILDTSLEGLLHGSLESARSTAALWARSRQQDVGWITVRDPAATWPQVELPQDARARMMADLQAGYTIVIPRTPIAIAGETVITWWRVDPRRGDILGIGERGWGSDEVEYTMTEEEINAFYVNWQRMTQRAIARGGRDLVAHGNQGLALGLAAGIFIGIIIGALMFLPSNPPPPPPPSRYSKG
jgi:hypothetical protein